MRARRTTVLAVGLAALAGCSNDEAVKPLEPASERGSARHFDVVAVTNGLNRPTYVGAAPGDRRALWVLEQPGRVVRVAGGRARRVLDLSNQVRTGAEQGLLGMAFHPDFARNGRLYLHWTNRAGDTRVAEFRMRRDGRVRPHPERVLLRVDQPEENHNGGQLEFGPDGRLYLGLGDGGGAFDPRRTAQDPEQKLGKILSADAGEERPRWRVELIGLRNPWRFSFDAGLNEIWVADVGQDAVEEIDRVLLEPDEPPKNLGWSAYEGTHSVEDGELSGGGEPIWPVVDYGHQDGCSVIGGSVYRGVRVPGLYRRYVYGDFCSGTLWSLRGTPAGRATDVRRERARLPQLTHIGTDGHDELVLASASGTIYRAVAPER